MTQTKVRLRVSMFPCNCKARTERRTVQQPVLEWELRKSPEVSDPFSSHFGSVSFFAEGPCLSEQKGIASVSRESDKTKISGQPSLRRRK